MDKLINLLIEKVTSWWDDLYPEGVFDGSSGDEGALRVKTIRDILNQINELKETKLLNKDTLESLDNSLDRDRHTHSSDYRAGWDQAFDVIDNWMKGV